MTELEQYEKQQLELFNHKQEGINRNRELFQTFNALSKNEDFKKVIGNYYFDTYLKMRVDDLSRKSMPENRDAVLRDIEAISSFKKFINHLKELGALADAQQQMLDEEKAEFEQYIENFKNEGND